MKAKEQLIYWASAHNPELYEDYLCELYEEQHGPHFDEEYARKAVDKMYHKENGVTVKGEHWTFDLVTNAIKPILNRFGAKDTCWDAYVALHIFYHDLGTSYRKRGLPDDILIDDAVTFFFNDEDTSEGKVWNYIHRMK